jgi:hypothetical protein
MNRRALGLPALLVAVAIVVGACGSSAPAITDPAEILTKAVETLQKAKSVHLDATLEGTAKLDLSGTGQASDLALTGTSLTADLDIANGNSHLNLAVPALLGLTAEVITVGGDTWTKTSLSGEKFQKGTASETGLPVDTTDPQKVLKDLQDWLAKPEVDPKKLDDASCGSKSCYQVEIDLSAADLKALIPEASGMADGSVVLTILVEKDSLRPFSVAVAASGADLGELNLDVSMSKWDESLSIAAPPADQVE